MCEHCGDCCRPEDMWTQAKLTWKQRYHLINLYEPVKGYCKMWNGRCLIQIEYGYEAKPQACKEHYCGSIH